ncbi:MAG: ZIP family metal transporter [Patescibacteria group bacterium]
MTIWLYAILSVVIVSLISLIGVFSLSIKREKLDKILIYFVSLSAGALLGDAFIHLIPEAYEKSWSAFSVSISILTGIVAFFIMEKFIHWRHCHKIPSEHHPHPFSYVMLAGDTIHNLIDGLIIGASYMVSIPVGIATTIAVIFHEIPQEVGDFGSLVYGGFSRLRALALNFMTALAAIFGTIVVLIFSSSENLTGFLIPFAAGGFIYVASADLIPELHKNTEIKKSIWQLVMFIFGIGLMVLLLFLFR